MPLASHQAMISSRQNPESPRMMICTSGHRWRIYVMIGEFEAIERA